MRHLRRLAARATGPTQAALERAAEDLCLLRHRTDKVAAELEAERARDNEKLATENNVLQLGLAAVADELAALRREAARPSWWRRLADVVRRHGRSGR
jgi:hypothetical protein